MFMKKIKVEQALIIFNGMPCVNVSVNISGLPVETFKILEAIGDGFYICNKNIDSRDNDFYVKEIESAIKYIKTIIKGRVYD